jgi:altronate hydrolase
MVVDVLDYGDPITIPGLNLLNGPGNDIVACTVLAVSGAHMVLFTTGRGTPLGGPVPTVKISSNTDLASRKKNWIDYNAGALVEGKTMSAADDELLEAMMDIASGRTLIHSERNGFREISIFKDGVTL